MAFSAPKHTTQDLLYLVPLSLFFLLYRLGSGSLASWDEAIYASVARGIVQSGDWFSLRYNGEFWPGKPPLAIWGTALFYLLFGVSELTSRLFSALCGVGCILATYALGRRFFNRWVGLLGALVLLSSSDFLRYARFGMLEAPLMLFVTLVLLFFWMGQGRNRYLIFSGVALGLAVLTKGFTAFLALPVIWLYALCANRMDVLARSSYWIGVMIAAAIALPWHLSQLVLYRAGAGAGPFSWTALLLPLQSIDTPGAHWYYYVRVLVNKYHPWILVGILTAPWTLVKAVKDRDDESVFLAVWLFFIFVAVTVFHLKRNWYILPVYPALSLTVAHALARVFHERRTHFVRAAFLVILALHVPYSHVFEHDYSAPVKSIAGAVSSRVPAGQKVVLYDYHESPAVSFYADRPSVYADTPESLGEALKAGLSYVLINKEDMENQAVATLFSRNRLVQVAEEGGLRLVVRKT